MCFLSLISISLSLTYSLTHSLPLVFSLSPFIFLCSSLSTGWLVNNGSGEGKDKPLIEIKRKHHIVLYKGYIHDVFLEKNKIQCGVNFEIDSNDHSLMTQTLGTLRMGPVIKAVVSVRTNEIERTNYLLLTHTLS